MKSTYRALLLFLATMPIALSNTACRADEKLSLEGAQAGGTKLTAVADGGLKVDFGTRDAWPNVNWKAPGENGWDWSNYEALVFTIQNPSDEKISFHVKIGDIGKDGKRKSTQISGLAEAGQTGRFYVSLQSRDLREKARMRVLPPLKGDYGTLLGQGVEPNNIREFQIFRSNPKTPSTLIIKSITLEGQAGNVNLDGIIDQYGQYTREDWPGKVKTDADLIAQKNAEDADLKANPGTSDRSKWGGWLGGPRLKATGFFRTEQVDGKWWMVDPDGYLFISVGIDVVRPNLSTIVRGREAMFNWLPKAGDPLAKYGSGNDYDFLRANLERKYGGDIDAISEKRSIERLKSWGFNTIGNWTPERLGKENQFPYVVAVGTKGGFATVPGHRGGKMPDPFDPAFAGDVDKNLTPKAAAAKGDPACIGYFFDNELPWGMPNLDNERYVLAVGALSLGPESPAKKAFVELVKGRYASIQEFNVAWGTTLNSWDELSAPLKVPASIKSPEQRRDFSDFLTIYAEKYFQVVSSAIKRQDPNHLYLGCRFAFWFTPEAVKASAKYVDAISFNIYGWNPNTYRFAQELGKPCIIGEFHFGSTDRGMFTGNMSVKDQNARGESYYKYIQDVLSEPAFIGAHWFQYYDEPTTGRGSDGENFNIGFLNIADAPYPELVDSARKANAQIYQWHKAAK